MLNNKDNDSDKKFLELPSYRHSIFVPTVAMAISTAVSGLMPFMFDLIEDAGGLFNLVGFNCLGALGVSILVYGAQQFLIMGLKKHYDNPNVLFLLDCLSQVLKVMPFLLGPYAVNQLFGVPFMALGLSMCMGMSAIFALTLAVTLINFAVTSIFEISKDCLGSKLAS